MLKIWFDSGTEKTVLDYAIDVCGWIFGHFECSCCRQCVQCTLYAVRLHCTMSNCNIKISNFFGEDLGFLRECGIFIRRLCWVWILTSNLRNRGTFLNVPFPSRTFPLVSSNYQFADKSTKMNHVVDVVVPNCTLYSVCCMVCMVMHLNVACIVRWLTSAYSENTCAPITKERWHFYHNSKSSFAVACEMAVLWCVADCETLIRFMCG